MQEVQHNGASGSTSHVMQWQMAMHRDEPCTSSSTSSGEGKHIQYCNIFPTPVCENWGCKARKRHFQC